MKNLSFAPVFALALASCASAQGEKPLYSFESEAEIESARLKSSVAKLVLQGVTQGQRALSVTFQPTTNFPSFNFPISTPLDWTGMGGLALDVTNPGAEPVQFSIRIDSAAALGTRGKSNSRSASATVGAGKTVSLLMEFKVEAQSPDMSGLPGLTLMRSPGAWTPFDISKIAAAQVFLNKPTAEKTLMLDNVRLVAALAPPPPMALQTGAKSLFSFETPDAAAGVKNTSASAKVVSEGATDGKSALQFTLEPNSPYPNVAFPFDEPRDFRGYGGLAFDLKNPGSESVRFGVRVDSAGGVGRKVGGSSSGGSSLEAGQSGTFLLPFGVDAAALGMKSLPGMGDFRNLGAKSKGAFELDKIASWQIFALRPSSAQTLILDNVRVIPGQKQDFTALVDRYGQYTRADWPGKVKTAADFQSQLAAEDADLKANPPAPDLNKFGGWKSGPQLKATGFFRVEKYQGKWTLVDPEGRLFFSVGPDTVQARQITKVAGREAMFSILPKDDAVLAQFESEDKTGLDIFGANLQRKYGAEYEKGWLDQTYRRLPSWGFNTIGAFSSFETKANGKVPYTAIFWTGKGHATVFLENKTVSDPYDPKFATDIARLARNMARGIADDPYFLGYFVGNEERWGDSRSGPREHYALILAAMLKTPEELPAKRAIIEQLRAKYGEVAKLNAAWKTTFADWNALDKPVDLDESLSAAVQADLSVLLRDWTERYHRIVREELKKADPNHLYLGGRFAAHNPEVVAAAAKYTDVMSFNIYRNSLDPKEKAMWDNYDHPILIGEFHFGATDRGMFDGGLVDVSDQNARGKAYQTYLRSVLDNPKFVGAHWFQYADTPTLGRADGENYNIGFVSFVDTPYPELIAAARAAHREIYSRRFGAG